MFSEQQDHVFEALHLLRDVQEDLLQVIQSQPEDAFGFSAMFFDGDGFLFVKLPKAEKHRVPVRVHRAEES